MKKFAICVRCGINWGTGRVCDSCRIAMRLEKVAYDRRAVVAPPSVKVSRFTDWFR